MDDVKNCIHCELIQLCREVFISEAQAIKKSFTKFYEMDQKVKKAAKHENLI